MGRPLKAEEDWFTRVADTMVREQKSIRQAAMEHGIACTSEELATIEKRKGFQAALWTARHRYNKELASNPERTKTALLGQMVFLVQKLIEEGEYDKALEGLLKLAKVEGFIGPDQQVNIFGGVTPADLQEARKRIESELAGGSAPNRSSSALSN